MSLHELLRELRELNVRLWVEDGNLRFAAPRALDPALKQRMIEHKPELIAALRQATRSGVEDVAAADAGDAPATDGDGLSFAQRRLLFLQRMDGDSAAYNLPMAWRLRGALDVDALRAAFAALPRRHDALQSSFRLVDGEYLPHRDPDAALALEVVSLEALPEDARESALRAQIDAQARAPFALEQAPLLRGALVRLAPDDHALLLTMHHLVSDGRSMELLVRDLWALAGGAADALPALTAGHGHYVDWQARWQNSESFARQKQYWVERLAGLPDLIELPVDHPRPAVQGYAGDVVHFELPPALTARLTALAQAQGASLYMLLLAAFGALLQRYTGQDDLAIGTPVANRRLAQWQQVLGFFSNVMVMRLAPQPARDFIALLGQVRDTALAGDEHQEFPFEQIVEHLHPRRSLSYSPLFQVMFILKEAAELGLPNGLEVEPLFAHNGISKFDLTLTVERGSARTVAGFEYATALFEQATIERMGAHFVRLLEQIAQAPARPLAELDLLTDAERAQQADWNATALDYDRLARVHELIRAQARRMPDAIAVSFEDEDVSFDALIARADALAAALRARGVGVEDRVGVYIDRSPAMVVALLGILAAGAAYVPLDPNYPADRIVHIAADAGLACLVTAGEAAARVPAVAAPVLALESLDGVRAAAFDDGGCSDNAAYVIYTSGSTGKPKGVVVTHRNVVNLFEGLDRSLAPSLPQDGDGRPVWTALTSISFDISVLELLWTLARGHHVLLQTDHLPTLTHAGQTPAGAVADARARPAADTPVRARPLTMGLFYFAADEDAQVDKYGLLLDGARFADSHGFSAVWVPERHFHAFGGQFPNPSVAAAAVAAVTRNVQVRAGSVVLPLHDPIRVAEEWSMVDNLSHGRAAVAFASGWHFNDFVLAPQNFAERHRVLREGIDTVRRLWKGETIERTDGLGNPARVGVRPRPVQPELPVWITAAASPETFRQAGELGANVLTHLLGQSLPELRAKIEIYRTARAEHGHCPDAGQVTLMLHTFIGEDVDTVRAAVREPFKAYLRSSINLLKPVAESNGLDAGNDLELVVEAGFNRYFATGALFGTPESCQSLLADIHAIGVDEIACLVDFGVAPAQVTDSFPQLDRLRRLTVTEHARRKREADRVAAGAEGQARVDIRVNATHIQCTPSFARLLLEQKQSQSLANLRGFLVGGEALPAEVARELRAATGAHLFNMYGPTETTVWSAVRHLQDAETTLGAPISNTRLYVLDARLRQQPVGIKGELYIAGEGVTRGYWQRPDLTAERFLPDPFAPMPGERMYRTGDLVRRTAEGGIEFLGRVDQQVKVRGYRIELGEIESALRAHPAVAEAVAVVRGAAPQDAAIVAYCTPVGADALDTAALHAHLAQRLPAHMLPSAIVELAAMPLTPNGKIDRKALPAPFQNQARAALQLPRTDLERALSELWCELLQIERVGVNENFFELGGHSLLLGTLQRRLAERFDCEISIIELFKFPTIDSLTRLIGQRENASNTAAMPSNRVREGRDAVARTRQHLKNRKRNG